MWTHICQATTNQHHNLRITPTGDEAGNTIELVAPACVKSDAVADLAWLSNTISAVYDESAFLKYFEDMQSNI